MTLAIFVLVTCLSVFAYLESRREKKEAAINEAYYLLEREHKRDLRSLEYAKAELKAAQQSIEEHKKQITQLKGKLSSSETKQAELEKRIPSYTQQEAELHEAIHQHIQQTLSNRLNSYATKYGHIQFGVANEITAQIVKDYVSEHNIKATISNVEY